MRHFFLLLCLAATGPLTAQAPVSGPERDTPSPIEDNSFLVEEAYNQERGVVQHASTFSRSEGSPAWTYTFTQEWPLGGQRNQLSYTLPLARNDDPAEKTTGIGDIALNYRYQIGGGEGVRFAFAPRATLLLPTGASRRGLGSGGAGFQVNFPLSAKLSRAFVAHSNAGLTHTPRARDAFGNVAAARSYALGQSIIWLTHPKLNLMLESTWTASHDVAGAGQTQRSTEFLLSPGLRGAIDLQSGLQIVPGLAFPFGVGGSRGERSVYAYLSFEHSFPRRSP